MKNYLLFSLLLLLKISLFAQKQDYPTMPISETTKKIAYQNVIDAKGIKKEALFLLMTDWASTAFVNSKSAIDYQDKESGIIAGNANFTAWVNTIQTHFRIEVKDEKIRYTFTDFVSMSSTPSVGNFPVEAWYPPKGIMRGAQVKSLNDIDSKIKSVVASMEEKIKSGKVDSDW